MKLRPKNSSIPGSEWLLVGPPPPKGGGAGASSPGRDMEGRGRGQGRSRTGGGSRATNCLPKGGRGSSSPFWGLVTCEPQSGKPPPGGVTTLKQLYGPRFGGVGRGVGVVREEVGPLGRDHTPESPEYPQRRARVRRHSCARMNREIAFVGQGKKSHSQDLFNNLGGSTL